MLLLKCMDHFIIPLIAWIVEKIIRISGLKVLKMIVTKSNKVLFTSVCDSSLLSNLIPVGCAVYDIYNMKPWLYEEIC